MEVERHRFSGSNRQNNGHNNDEKCPFCKKMVNRDHDSRACSYSIRQRVNPFGQPPTDQKDQNYERRK